MSILGMQYAPGQTIGYTFYGSGEAVYDRGIPGGVRALSEDAYQLKAGVAFRQWEAVANVHFAEVTDPASADLSIFWDRVDWFGGVLGYAAIWDRDGNGLLEGPDEVTRIGMDPADADVFSQTILHEVGHVLGLGHETGYPSVMHPQIGQATSFISSGDIVEIQGLYGAPSMPVVRGTDDDDYLHRAGGAAGHDFRAGRGNDTAWGSTGGDVIYGNQGDDLLDGNYGDDTLYGGQDVDRLNGGPGNDVLYGNLGGDTLSGGDGLDLLYGGQGNDAIYAGEGDTVIGGLGSDTIYAHPLAIIGQHDPADVVLEWLGV